MIAGLVLVIRLVLMLLVTAVLAFATWVARLFRLKSSQKIPRLLNRLLLRIIGVRVNIHGDFSTAHPLLLVSNHVSWVDILVMGSLKEICFIAKSEINSWPVINKLARLQGTVFIDRNNRRHAAIQADTIANRLLHGDVMVLFAEGTTSDGNKILDFNSSLLGAAQYAIKQSHIDHVMVQPVAITYTRLHGIPLGRRYQPLASWPGDVGLMPHLLGFLKNSAFDVDVMLGEPLEFSATTNRKALTKAANIQVSKMFGKALRGDIGPTKRSKTRSEQDNR
ncbi:MAG: 1-acyl-sn-glycerol-3-phosphate acyltransferase [Rhizobiaceae bacterium]|nr:1-acyl-sn-glycerol-3-phosphate acyltransferase [Rhizobiaceae bacterium]